MRIVIDATASVSGGSVYIRQLLPLLFTGTEGDRFIVFHGGDLDGIGFSDAGGRVEFRRVSSAARGNWLIESIRKLLWRQIIFPFHLLKIRPELLFSNAGVLPPFLPRGTRSVVAIHNSMPLREDLIRDERSFPRRMRLRLLNRLMRRTLARCDAAIVFSEDSRRRVVNAAQRSAFDPTVVYHGIDWGEEERLRAADDKRLAGYGISKPYLLFVSQFHRYKNLLRLIGALAVLRERHEELSLVLAGEAADIGYWREVIAETRRLGLSHALIHLPQVPRDDLIEIYNGARAFVHPSLAETCSFPLLEAMALGVPIAAARASALPEIAGDAAVYFDPDDENDMAEVIDRLLSDEQLRDELKSRAVSRATKFSWEETGSRTLEVIREVAGRQRN